MEDKLNIMLFSDHGMTKIQWMEKVIELDKYINMSTIAKMMDRGPVVSLWPKVNKYNEVSLINKAFHSGFTVLIVGDDKQDIDNANIPHLYERGVPPMATR